MKRHLLIVLFLSVLGLLAFVPGKDDPIDRFVTSLQRWADNNPQEKVYLHMDKPYYALGDTIWFKGYVTIGSRHQLSKMSGALHVELLDEKDSLLSTLKLPVTAGMAMGDFTLGDTYKAGNYRIRAYTQWMRNGDEEYFFDKTFAVGDPLSPGAAAKDTRTSQDAVKNDGAGSKTGRSADVMDIQFFPEGGNMVNKLSCRIGFKVVGPDGKGPYVKGIITDNTEQEITSFESTHAGMGVFNLVPESGKSYRAKLTFSDGSEKTIELPRAVEQGYGLSIYQPGGDSVLVRINASASMYTTPQSVNLVVQSGGEAIFASQVKITQRINSVWLKKSDFPSGIAQFTLFDGRAEPINERIAFIKSNDRMELNVSTAKKTYGSRERVDIDLEAVNRSGKPIAGNFSVSVIDESKVPSDEDNETSIFSSMLLSSDLKGYIERPNYYFTKDTIQTNKALDNLMLTQGYRRFVWKDILNITAAQNKPLFNAESLGTEISGRVLTLTGKPVVNGTVTLMALNQGFMEVEHTDMDGRFRYKPIMLADSLRFAVQATTYKKSKKVEVILDSIPGMRISKNKNRADFAINNAISTEVYLENSRRQDEVMVKMGMTGRINRLKEVRINAKRTEKEQYSPQGMFIIPEGHADQTFFVKDEEKCGTLGACLAGKLGGVLFVQMGYVLNYPVTMGTGGTYERLTVILDGRKLQTDVEIADLFDFNGIEYNDIIKIDVIRRNLALMSMLSTGPVLLIYTKAARLRNKKYNPNIANIKPKGFNKAREFYAPRYDQPNVNQQLPDLRSTIYWNAKLKTYASGRTRFSYYNADGPGKYKVVIEGINAEGELGRQVYRYEVTGEGAQKEASASTLKDGRTSEIVKAMQNLQQNTPAEKLYVHTDKSYYNLGDTLWLKAYLFDATSLAASKRSGILYVELNDDTAEAVRRISIPIKEGIGYAQIPLTRKIFHEGGYTFRAYTNWMQNFGNDFFFSKRFYLGIPTTDTWLVRSSSNISKQGDKEQLQTDVVLTQSDQSAVGLREVEIKVMEGDKERYKERKQTSADGKLELNYNLREKMDGRNIRLEIRNLNKADGNQRLMIPVNVRRPQKIDLQFFPESGYLVAGLKSVVGFKAIAEDGKGLQVTGDVYDSKGTMVHSFSSLYNGMGSFEFIPGAGEIYTARLKQPEVLEKVFAFPPVKSEGIILHVQNRQESESLEVNIGVSSAAVTNTDTLSLIATSRTGVITWAQVVEAGKSNFSIEKKMFPTGITRFTLLKNRNVLNERIVYIDRQENLQISINPDKQRYAKRDSVSLVVEVKDKNGSPVRGNFSISVTDDSQVKPDSAGNFGIVASLLLNADLKGTVETPGYYLNRNYRDSWQALDNLMLTQGWVGYDWKNAFKPVLPPAFEAERYFRIRGEVTNIFKKPVKGAQMVISSQKPAFINTSISDEQGKFIFENLPPIDSGAFFIQARTPKGRTMNFGEVMVHKFKAPDISENFRDQLSPWYVNSEQTQLNYVKNVIFKADESSLKQSGIPLKEVKIVDKKIIKGSYNRNISGGADLVFDEQDIKESGVMDLYQLLKQKLPGFRAIMEDGLPTLKYNDYMVTIEIDGGGLPIAMNSNPGVDELIEELKEFKISNFKGLEVLYSKKYLGKYGVGKASGGTLLKNIRESEWQLRSGASFTDEESDNLTRPQPYYQFRMHSQWLDQRANVLTNRERNFAVILIKTGSDRGWYKSRKPDFATYRPLPVMHPQEFYRPRYKASAIEAAEPDYRSTIYWKPDVTTDMNGRAVLSFYTSDITGRYTINLQGADMDGNIGEGTVPIKVEIPAK